MNIKRRNYAPLRAMKHLTRLVVGDITASRALERHVPELAKLTQVSTGEGCAQCCVACCPASQEQAVPEWAAAHELLRTARCAWHADESPI